MNNYEEVRIQYASKYAGVSNYWKYFIGQSKRLKRLDVKNEKEKEEEKFERWVAASADREKYQHALPNIEKAYVGLDSTALSNVYINEAAFGIELYRLAYQYARYSKNKEVYKKKVDLFFKDYDADTDKDLMANMLRMYINGVPAVQLPTFLLRLEKKYKGNYEKYVDKVFKKSIFTSEEKLLDFIENPHDTKLKKDPAYQGFYGILGDYQKYIQPSRTKAYDQLKEGQQLFIEAQRKMYPEKIFYPDANSTMRLTYGSVLPYSPGDAKFYNYQTTANGILEKADAEDPEFMVPEKLIKLIKEKDFGAYGEENELPVNFLTNNDITGGNSGSGVINANGELIGIAFDGNWEAMSGDIAFSPKLQRTISVDIRYVLFVIDKYAGATHLIDEMDIRP